eukprot:m.113847 g.113847  ORF g.113847 m.113847 type:complete len:422 (+) comp17105_c0_seq1:140-1405(+)
MMKRGGKGTGVGGDRSRIVMKLSADEQAQCESPANLNKIADIEAAWPTGGQPLQRPGRLFVCESLMHKMCRKGLKARYFWLCNDVLIYGAPITKGKYKGQVVLPLVDMAVEDIEDSAEGANGIQINDKRKSFIVYLISPTEKNKWIATLNRYIGLSREAAGLDPESRETDARALWIPDMKVKSCMVAGCTNAFSLRQRKHHCRNCGKVVCGPCSVYRAVLNKVKPERVCKTCHTKLGGTSPQDVPVLGQASSEKHTREADSSDDDSSDEEAEATQKEDPSIAIMRMVKDGTMTMEEAVARIAARDWVQERKLPGDPSSPPPSPKIGKKSIASPLAGADNDDGEANASVVGASKVPDGPYAMALYDNRDTQHDEEIGFDEGDIICLTQRLSEEWMEGYRFSDPAQQHGMFPTAFVEVIVDLP